jgi:nitrogen fixation NifU-like protein
MVEPFEHSGAGTGSDPFWGRMSDPVGSARVVGLCGDDMEFYLDIRDGVIADVRYYSNGCADTRACGRAAAERAVGKPVMDVLSLSPRQIIDALPELSAPGRHCAILAVSALHRAVADYLLMP